MVEINVDRLSDDDNQRVELGVAYFDAVKANIYLYTTRDLKNNLFSLTPTDAAMRDVLTDNDDILLSDRNVCQQYRSRYRKYNALSNAVKRSVVTKDFTVNDLTPDNYVNLIDPQLAFTATITDNTVSGPERATSYERYSYKKAVMIHASLMNDNGEHCQDLCKKYNIDPQLFNSAEVVKDAQRVRVDARDTLFDYVEAMKSNLLMPDSPDQHSINGFTMRGEKVYPSDMHHYQALRDDFVTGLRHGLNGDSMEFIDSDGFPIDSDVESSLGRMGYNMGNQLNWTLMQSAYGDERDTILHHLAGNYIYRQVDDALKSTPVDELLDNYRLDIDNIGIIANHIQDPVIKRELSHEILMADDETHALGSEIESDMLDFGLGINVVKDAAKILDNNQPLSDEARKYLSVEDQQTIDNYLDSVKNDEYEADSSKDDLLKNVNVMVDPDSVNRSQLVSDEANVELNEQSLQHDVDMYFTPEEKLMYALSEKTESWSKMCEFSSPTLSSELLSINKNVDKIIDHHDELNDNDNRQVLNDISKSINVIRNKHPETNGYRALCLDFNNFDKLVMQSDFMKDQNSVEHKQLKKHIKKRKTKSNDGPEM